LIYEKYCKVKRRGGRPSACDRADLHLSTLQTANELLKDVDPGDNGELTLQHFEELFFSSTERYKICVTPTHSSFDRPLA